jgi:hypothetical protein
LPKGVDNEEGGGCLVTQFDVAGAFCKAFFFDNRSLKL